MQRGNGQTSGEFNLVTNLASGTAQEQTRQTNEPLTRGQIYTAPEDASVTKARVSAFVKPIWIND